MVLQSNKYVAHVRKSLLTDSLALSFTQFSLQTLFSDSAYSVHKHGATLAIIKAVDGLIGSEGFKNGFALAQFLAC